MLWDFCSFCGNISLQELPNGMKRCPRCGWEGIPKTGGMEAINAVAKAYVIGTKYNPTKNPEESKSQKQNQETIIDKETNSSENHLSNKKISKKVPKNKELLERLKDKNFNGTDFL